MSNGPVVESHPETVGAGISGALADLGPGELQGAPAWFAAKRAEGWSRFRQLPSPARTDQSWRFANLKALDLARYSAPRPVTDARAAEAAERSGGGGEAAGRLVLLNDEAAGPAELAKEFADRGVLWMTVREAMAARSELLRERFMEHSTPLGGAKYEALHQACASNGVFLYVPDGVEIGVPLHAFHWIDGDGASAFPHTLIVAGAGSKVTLIDHFRSMESTGANFACAVNDIYAGLGAQIRYACVQDWNRQTVSVQINSTTVGAGASVAGLNPNLGGGYSRFESVSHLTGEGARSDMLAATFADGSQEFDMRTLQDHLAPGAASDLLFKSVLADSAHAIFAGLIRVEEGAHRTDAYQKNPNLLLSDEAVADSMPGLEILADDVRCTHGATAGYLDPEQLFYLRARGIGEAEAKRLLVVGFLDEVIARFGDADAATDALRELISARLGLPG